MSFNKFLYHIQRCDKYQMLVRSILVYPSETMKFQSSEIPSFYFNFCCLLAHITQNISDKWCNENLSSNIQVYGKINHEFWENGTKQKRNEVNEICGDGSSEMRAYEVSINN